MTQTALADLLAADLSGLKLAALMIDGVNNARALVRGRTRHRHRRNQAPIGRSGGLDGEHHRGQEPADGLRDRGLDTTRPILAVLDGVKALAAGVREVFDKPVIARCQLHKLRNVRDHLPEKMRGPVTKRMREAYHAGSALGAQALLEALAKELDKTHPAPPAASVRAWPRR